MPICHIQACEGMQHAVVQRQSFLGPASTEAHGTSNAEEVAASTASAGLIVAAPAECSDAISPITISADGSSDAQCNSSPLLSPTPVQRVRPSKCCFPVLNSNSPEAVNIRQQQRQLVATMRSQLSSQFRTKPSGCALLNQIMMPSQSACQLWRLPSVAWLQTCRPQTMMS
jgi:hypothetical protein